MVNRIAKEWLWLLGAVITAIGLSLIYRDAFWRVGETGVALVSLYGLSVLVRTTIWAVSTARKTASP
jgi:predicted membrane channel-forming protein YqfA (hemolysin III family)